MSDVTTRAEVQARAKELGIPANKSTDDLLKLIADHEAEAEPAETTADVQDETTAHPETDAEPEPAGVVVWANEPEPAQEPEVVDGRECLPITNFSSRGDWEDPFSGLMVYVGSVRCDQSGAVRDGDYAYRNLP
jgi:hypothetical protein